MRSPITRALSAVVVTVVSTATVAALVTSVAAAPIPSAPAAAAPTPPAIQTPVLTVGRACRMTKGVALTVALTKTGALGQLDGQGHVISYVPAVYAIGDSTFTHTSGRGFSAGRVGATIRDRLALPGTYRVGQRLTVKAVVDYPGDLTYAPAPNLVTVTVKSCDTAPRAWFTGDPGIAAHQVDLSAADSLGNGLRYTWLMLRGKKWVRIGQGLSMSRTFSAAGTVTIRLVIVDRSGRSAKYTRAVKVF